VSGYRITKDCPLCARPVGLKNSSRGTFVGCTGFPRCRYTEPYDDALWDIANQLRAARYDAVWFQEAITEIKTTLRDAVKFAHPDKWPSAMSEIANGVTARLNALIDKL
jgi:ssDNA-binding Zn-finger/Zn-ribbon topoisomerase 1